MARARFEYSRMGALKQAVKVMSGLNREISVVVSPDGVKLWTLSSDMTRLAVLELPQPVLDALELEQGETVAVTVDAESLLKALGSAREAKHVEIAIEGNGVVVTTRRDRYGGVVGSSSVPIVRESKDIESEIRIGFTVTFETWSSIVERFLRCSAAVLDGSEAVRLSASSSGVEMVARSRESPIECRAALGPEALLSYSNEAGEVEAAYTIENLKALRDLLHIEDSVSVAFGKDMPMRAEVKRHAGVSERARVYVAPVID